ncbi:MAG: hypothetical protein ACXVB4_00610 [Pseudobdellovibrionaceae bacterium]
MMKFIIYTTFLLFSYLVYGFYISQYQINVIPRKLKSENPPGYYDYRGIINVHSDISIGSSSSLEIASEAKLADLDFLILTDLNAFENNVHNDSYSQNILFLTGGKYSYLDSRLIFYSANKYLVGANLGEAQIRFADMLTQKEGGNKDSLSILAHPYKLGFSWTGDLPPGLDGIEVINIKSLSVQAWQHSKASVIWSFLIYPFNPGFSLARLFLEPTEELALLDKTTQHQKIFAFAGAEASARAIPLANYLIRFPSYQRNFEIASNHVLLSSELTGNLNTDRQKIFSALKKGQFYLAFDALGDPKGFVTTLEDKGRSYPMGSQARFSKGMVLNIALPGPPQNFFEIIVYRNGERFKTINTAEATVPITEPGIYRVQVRIAVSMPLPDANRWISWIYSNPFFISP